MAQNNVMQAQLLNGFFTEAITVKLNNVLDNSGGTLMYSTKYEKDFQQIMEFANETDAIYSKVEEAGKNLTDIGDKLKNSNENEDIKFTDRVSQVLEAK